MRNSTLLSLLLWIAFGLSVGAWAQGAGDKALLAAIQANPNDAKAHFNLGVSYFNNHHYEESIPEFQKCIQLNPADSQSKELLENSQGLVALSKGDYQTAITHFQSSLKINPNNPDTNRLLNQCQAQVSMDQGHYAEAVTALTEVLRSDPDNMSICQSLGVAYLQLKDYKKAAIYWEKMPKAQRDAQTYKFLGFAYYNLGDFGNAILNYKKSIAVESAKDPKDQKPESLDETYYNLAVAYNDNALYDEAADAFGQAFKMNPKDSNAAVGQSQAIVEAVNAHTEKASGFLLNSQYSDAMTEAQKVLAYQPDNAQAVGFLADAKAKLDVEVAKHLKAGRAYAQKGKTIQALAEWNSILEMDPANEAALAYIKKAKVKNSEQVKALLKEGDELYREKDYAGALEKYSTASKISPSSGVVKAALKKLHRNQQNDFEDYYDKGKGDLKKGELKGALAALESACRIEPNNTQAQADLFFVRKEVTAKKNDLLESGVGLFEGGNKEEAQKKFQAVLSLDPNNDKANEYIKKMTGQQSQAKVDDEKAKALYYEGVNLYINGKIREAIVKWKECKLADPGNVNAQNNIDKANAKLQSIEKLSQ